MSGTPPLSEQVVLITGASSGIGEALAKILAAEFPGIRLVLAARRRERLEGVARECRQAGAIALVRATDLSDPVQAKALAQGALAEFGRVDALINNAGYGQMGPMELVPPEAAREQFAVNFHAPLILSQTLIPAMRGQGGGRIVNISSLGGRMAFPTAGSYSCSKFALEALTDVLRMELKGFGIHAIAIEPGPTSAEFFQAAWKRVQETIPDFDQTPYAPALEKLAALDRQLQSLGWRPERVARVILRSLTDCPPRPRYLAATGGNFFVPLMAKWMPTWLTDAFWKHFYGIDRVERTWIGRRGESVTAGRTPRRG